MPWHEVLSANARTDALLRASVFISFDISVQDVFHEEGGREELDDYVSEAAAEDNSWISPV